MKNIKRKWVYVVVISTCFVFFLEMKASYAAEDGKATVVFYEVKKTEQHETDAFPRTGEASSNQVLLLSGISILLFITGMISYRILTNEERM
ncbi:LPXTG cell wall anchor domain-containing protein [Enterococcus rotai]|uniref:LPXTG cell wall anchor domain-containing protein n=1 Tax=Enterococcus rotai TaxID=118060 RepID=UPI0032B47E57